MTDLYRRDDLAQGHPAQTGERDPYSHEATEFEGELVALFVDEAAGLLAQGRLIEAGMEPGRVSLLTWHIPPKIEPPGLISALKRFLTPHADHLDWEEELRRGHAVLVVRPAPGDGVAAVQLLAQCAPMDFDARLEEWRANWWQSSREDQAAEAAAEADDPDMPPTLQP